MRGKVAKQLRKDCHGCPKGRQRARKRAFVAPGLNLSKRERRELVKHLERDTGA